MWLRGHISVFAAGSVILLATNLLRGSGGIWADTAISAWAILVVSHGILMIIARLLQELLADEERAGIRPASEMHWNTRSTWTLAQRVRERASGHAPPSSPPPSPTPTLDPEASAAAAAARERKPKSQPQPAPQQAPSGTPAAPEPDELERVPWQTATDAAWLATPDITTQPPEPDTPPGKKDDDEGDFTPLKFD